MNTDKPKLNACGKMASFGKTAWQFPVYQKAHGQSGWLALPFAPPLRRGARFLYISIIILTLLPDFSTNAQNSTAHGDAYFQSTIAL
jgi:hypothetical protein